MESDLYTFFPALQRLRSSLNLGSINVQEMSPSQSGLVLLCHSCTLEKVLDAAKIRRMFSSGCGSGGEAPRTGMSDSDREGTFFGKLTRWVILFFLTEETGYLLNDCLCRQLTRLSQFPDFAQKCTATFV